MPYIKQERREEMRAIGASGHHPTMQVAGELNFEITVKINKYLETHDLCYQTINDIVGALEGAKLEFYRRVVAPYEDQKILENGDVYPVHEDGRSHRHYLAAFAAGLGGS